MIRGLNPPGEDQRETWWAPHEGGAHHVTLALATALLDGPEDMRYPDRAISEALGNNAVRNTVVPLDEHRLRMLRAREPWRDGITSER